MKQKVTRRSVIGAGLAGAVAAVAEPAMAGFKSTAREETRDVCIVGAGFAGLYAAKKVMEKNKSFIILEARERVGGRVWTIPDDARGWLDRGGQWVGGDQHLFEQLIKDVGGETYPSPNKGLIRARGVDAEGKLGSYESLQDVPGYDMIKKALDKMDAIADSINKDAPWLAAHAAKWDSITFAEWMRQEVPDEKVRMYLDANVSYACANLSEISMLALMAIIKQCGGFKMLDEDAQATRIIHGAQSIAKKLALKLGYGAVLHNHPVRKIAWHDQGATVYTDTLTVHAKHVIVTAPPSLAGSIEYEPSLPADRSAVTMRWPQGRVIKAAFIYDTPFWRDLGYSGGSLDYKAVAVETADSSCRSDYSKRGILTAFVYTHWADKILPLTEHERKVLLLQDLRERFTDRVLNLLHYEETLWSQEVWTRGCYGAFLTPGTTTLYKNAIRHPAGPLHWAGTETSDRWPTFIEGALQSGMRAVREIYGP